MAGRRSGFPFLGVSAYFQGLVLLVSRAVGISIVHFNHEDYEAGQIGIAPSCGNNILKTTRVYCTAFHRWKLVFLKAIWRLWCWLIAGEKCSKQVCTYVGRKATFLPILQQILNHDDPQVFCRADSASYLRCCEMRKKWCNLESEHGSET